MAPPVAKRVHKWMMALALCIAVEISRFWMELIYFAKQANKREETSIIFPLLESIQIVVTSLKRKM